jgi:DNA-binding IclR family transcriptional regulator
MAAKDNVLEIFKNTDKTLRLGEIAEKTGIESKEVTKIIKELREEGKVYSPKRCYYTLKLSSFKINIFFLYFYLIL